MKKIATFGLGLFLIISLIQCNTVQEKEIKPQLDSYFEQMEEIIGEGDKPGYSMIITKKDSIIYKRNFGSADLDKSIPITEKTIFNLASVSKQFTGMAIAILEEQGEIEISDKISKYLPDLPEAMNDITIYQLIHHSSGIRDWPMLFGLKGWQPEEPLSLDDIYEMLKKQEGLNFIPSTEFSYSNSNYNLLAKIVEVVTDTTFNSWIHDFIFVPLGMNNTSSVDDNDQKLADMANSYVYLKQKYIPFSHKLNAPGSSSLRSNAEDMSKWMINFYSKSVGGENVFDQMTQKGELDNNNAIDYGYGLYISEINNKEAYFHDGVWGGYRIYTVFFPEDNIGIVILSNNGVSQSRKTMNDISDILFCTAEKKKSTETEIEVVEQEINDEFFALCAGKYQQVDDKNTYLTFFKDGDAYFLNMNNGNYKLYAKSDSVYFIKEAEAEFVFHLRNEEVNSHALNQNGNSYLALRVEEDKKEANINYDSLTGIFYSSELDVNYEIRYENEELLIHSKVFPEDIFLEHSEDLVFKSNSGLIQSISFLEENGAITSLVINNPRVRNLIFGRIN